MCDSGTPLRRVAVCGCWRPGALIAAGTVAVGAAAGIWAPVFAAVAVAAAGVAGVVGVLAWRRRLGIGVALVHRYTPPAAVQAQPAPARAPVEVPWYDRARVGGQP